MSDHPCTSSPDVAAYALGALEDSEAERFAAHLVGCSHCTEELSELQFVVNMLPSGVPAATASPALKARVMSVVNSEAELLRAAGPEADRPPAPASRRRWMARPVFGLGGALGVAAAAAAVVVIAAGSGGTSVHTTTGSSIVSTASVVLRQSGGRAELDVADMKPPAADHVYQVWLQRGGQAPRPTDALFAVNRQGDAAVVVPGSLKGVQHVYVTTEPSGGSPNGKPSGPPVISVTLST
jgi:anti-sigma-K factor RskA